MEKFKKTDRLSSQEKEANNHEWYKWKLDNLINTRGMEYSNNYYHSRTALSDVNSRLQMKVNYDLYANKLNLDDFQQTMRPYGVEVGDLPVNFENRDIVSPKIDAVLGMEQKMPFVYEILATNSEATTRKEQKELDLMKESINNFIMLPIRQKLEQEIQQSMQGQQLTAEQQQQLMQQLEEEMQVRTPKEVKKYMAREHQDPAEILMNQLIEYFSNYLDIKTITNTAFKHGLLAGFSVVYNGIVDNEPVLWCVNPLRFYFDFSGEIPYIEDSDYALCEFKMTPAQIVSYFSELTNEQIDDLYNNNGEDTINDTTWAMFYGNDAYDEGNTYSSRQISVFHGVWKSLRKIGFLTYVDEEGEPQSTIVDESYRLDEAHGDIELTWRWLPEVYEAWKVGKTYLQMRPVPGQLKDMDNLKECRLPYYGVIYNGLNTSITSLMDKLKPYQYLYNIILFKLQMLLASDKGKKLLLNINAIPNSLGIDTEKWQYFFESHNIGWLNPDEEGMTYNDINIMAKEVDLSLASNINNYINLLEYVRTLAGKSVGIPEQVEGQIQQREAVANVQKVMNQSTNILNPIFDMHALFKKNLLTALIENVKVCYRSSDKKFLSYVLDDMTQQLIHIDTDLLSNSTYGLFLADTSKNAELKDVIKQLSLAAMQNQTIDMSAVIALLKQDNITEAQEMLKQAEIEKEERAMKAQQQQQQMLMQAEEVKRQMAQEQHQYNIEEIVVKEEERRKTELAKTALLGASYNPDKDADNDGQNDYVELSRELIKQQTEREKLKVKREELSQKNKIEQQKIALEKQKIAKESKKSA